MGIAWNLTQVRTTRSLFAINALSRIPVNNTKDPRLTPQEYLTVTKGILCGMVEEIKLHGM
jgi:hypothetical protein